MTSSKPIISQRAHIQIKPQLGLELQHTSVRTLSSPQWLVWVHDLQSHSITVKCPLYLLKLCYDLNICVTPNLYVGS